MTEIKIGTIIKGNGLNKDIGKEKYTITEILDIGYRFTFKNYHIVSNFNDWWINDEIIKFLYVHLRKL